MDAGDALTVWKLPPKAFFLRDSLKAMAIACFCGRPLWTSSLIFELTVSWLLPFLSGMVYPGEYVTLMDWPVPGVTTKPVEKICPNLTMPTVAGIAQSALDAATVLTALVLLMVPTVDPATTTEKFTRYPLPT